MPWRRRGGGGVKAEARSMSLWRFSTGAVGAVRPCCRSERSSRSDDAATRRVHDHSDTHEAHQRADHAITAQTGPRLHQPGATDLEQRSDHEEPDERTVTAGPPVGPVEGRRDRTGHQGRSRPSRGTGSQLKVSCLSTVRSSRRSCGGRPIRLRRARHRAYRAPSWSGSPGADIAGRLAVPGPRSCRAGE